MNTSIDTSIETRETASKENTSTENTSSIKIESYRWEIEEMTFMGND